MMAGNRPRINICSGVSCVQMYLLFPVTFFKYIRNQLVHSSSSSCTVYVSLFHGNKKMLKKKKKKMFFKKVTKIKRAKKMIYITEFSADSDNNFSRTRKSVLMVGQRLRCWPTLKSTILKWSFIFQVSDILHTGTEIKHDIICIYHPYHTK